jgi:hypothetical protein
MTLDKSARESRSNVEERLIKLGKITNEIINSLAKQKVDGKTINVADIYFILSGALQQVSYMNVVEIEDYKQKKTQQQKIVI